MRLSLLGFGCGAVGGGLMVRGDPLDQRTIARATAAGKGYFFFLGARLPFLRAFESAMAMACLRLFTLPPLPPLPLLAVPRL
jgi:hypothetical protein